METIETIIQWHKETFPDTTLEEQWHKFELEMEEFDKAKSYDNKVKELADMFIATCGIARFSLSFSLIFFSIIYKKLKHLESKQELNFDKAINDKMAINRKRKWHKVNGEYRHI
jgi:lipopolysaccharide/colanic/teichoic acid biosynthesis glycosyltransferase